MWRLDHQISPQSRVHDTELSVPRTKRPASLRARASTACTGRETNSQAATKSTYTMKKTAKPEFLRGSGLSAVPFGDTPFLSTRSRRRGYRWMDCPRRSHRLSSSIPNSDPRRLSPRGPQSPRLFPGRGHPVAAPCADPRRADLQPGPGRKAQCEPQQPRGCCTMARRLTR